MNEIDDVIQAALCGHRTEARELWQRIADGRIDEALQRWLQQVAGKILEADSGKHRGDAIAAAVGLRGAVDKNRNMRELVKYWDSLPLGPDGKRGQDMRDLINTLRSRGLIEDITSDDEARKRIDRVRKG